MTQEIFYWIDIVGTFVFAISGAVASIDRRLDIFGSLVVSFATACGGGVLRDVIINQVPAGLTNLEYLLLIILAVVLSALFLKRLRKLESASLFFDAVGLGFFACFGAHKAFVYSHNVELSIILGVVSAVGGGVVRDILLGRIPVILKKEIYASAALVGASIQITGDYYFHSALTFTWIGLAACVTLRLLSIKFDWKLYAIKS